MAKLDLVLVAEGLQFPEGPVAVSDGSVLIVEMQARRVTRVRPDGRLEVVAETGGGPNGLAIGPDGALYLTNNGGAFQFSTHQGLNIPGSAPPGHTHGSIQRIDLESGAVTSLYESCDGRPLLAPNDLVFDRQGGFWFTDFGPRHATHKVYGGLYHAKADGSHISRQRDALLSPNGVGLSPDEKTVYVAETMSGRLWAYDIAAPGELAQPASPLAPGRVVASPPGLNRFDSLAVEASGVICVATIVNGGIYAISPDGSAEHFEVPDPIVTNICFGGADMRDAWITASGTGRLYKARWPRPGLRLNFNV